MSDVQFLDLSQFNAPLDLSYPDPLVVIRSGDGTVHDSRFATNRAVARQLVDAGRMIGYGAYHVWRPYADHGLGTLLEQVGLEHDPHLFIEWDIESWGGQIVGDHSRQIRDTMRLTVQALNERRPDRQRLWWNRAYYRWCDRKRVRLYGNAGDLVSICPRRPRRAVRLADYDGNPRRPRHWAHQYTSAGAVGKWSPVDVNSADGATPRSLARRLGLVRLVQRLP